MRPNLVTNVIPAVLTQLIILAAAVPELRIGPSGFVFATSSYSQALTGVGYPRVCELLALLLVVVSIPGIFRGALADQEIRINVISIAAYLGALGLVLYYHNTAGWDRYRAGLLVPFGVYLAIITQKLQVKAQKQITNTALAAGAFGSLTVITQPWIPDLFPVINNYDWLDSSRFMGSGQSPAYQGVYLLIMATPLVASLRNESSTIRVSLGLTLLALTGVAIAMTGTRMFIFVYAGLLLYSLSKSIKIAIFSISLGLAFLAIVTLSSPENAITLTLRGVIDRASYVEVGRAEPWQVAFRLLISNPLLGIGNFEIAVAKMGLEVPAHAQNVILGQALLGGLPLLLLFAYIVYRVLSGAVKSKGIKNSQEKIRKSTAIALAFVYLCAGVTEIVDASTQVQLGFFVLVATLTFRKSPHMVNQGAQAKGPPPPVGTGYRL
jgi:hypothetical protein